MACWMVREKREQTAARHTQLAIILSASKIGMKQEGARQQTKMNEEEEMKTEKKAAEKMADTALSLRVIIHAVAAKQALGLHPVALEHGVF